MTRKRVGSGLIEVFSENCEHCNGRGIIVHAEPVEKVSGGADSGGSPGQARSRSRRGKGGGESQPAAQQQAAAQPTPSGPTPAQIAAAAHAAALKSTTGPVPLHGDEGAPQDEPALQVSETDIEDQAREDQPAEEQTGRQRAGQDQPRGAEPSEAEPSEAEPRGTEPSAPAAAQLVPASEPAAAPAPKRRKRGRVVAPAGPPRPSSAGHSESGETTAEPAPTAAS